MAESAFNFNSAPNGNMRQFGVLASTLGLKSSKLRSSGGSSLGAKDQAELAKQSAVHQAMLNDQTHAQNMQLESHRAGLSQQNDTMGVVARHVVGQEAEDMKHKRGMESSYQDKLFKNTEGMAERASKEKLARGKNAVDRAKIKADLQKDYQSRLFAGSEAAANRQHESDRSERSQAMATNNNIRSFNPTTGAFATTHPMQEGQQFNGVGETQA
jgi:hypothetical protein